MPWVQGMPEDELDGWVEEVEENFASAMRRSLRGLQKSLAIGRVLVAAGEPAAAAGAGGSSVSAADVALTAEDAISFLTAWTSETGSLNDDLHTVFTAGAYGLAADIGETVLPPAAADSLIVPPVVNTMASEYMVSASNRVKGLGDMAWDETRSQISQGMSQGESIEEITKRVQHAATVSENRARTVARTETIMAANAGGYAQARVLPEVVQPVNKQWLSTSDRRTRMSHVIANEQIQDLEKPFHVGGWPLMYPGDTRAPASEVVNCRCTTLYDVDEVDCACPTPTSLVAAAGDNTGTSVYRIAREATGLSRAQMAKQLGWPMSQLWKIEVGKAAATPAQFSQIMQNKHFNTALHNLGVTSLAEANSFDVSSQSQAMKQAMAQGKTLKQAKAVKAKPGETQLGDCACKKTSVPGPAPSTQPITKQLPQVPKTYLSKGDLESRFGKNEETAQTLFDAHSQTWYPHLDQSEVDAVHGYQLGSEDMNAALRAGEPYPGANTLMSALNKAETPEEVTVWRTLDSVHVKKYQTGDVFDDKGFASTFTHYDNATVSASPGFSTVMEIRVPKGTKGAYLPAAGQDEFEAELLLQAGTNFKVIGRRIDVLPSGEEIDTLVVRVVEREASVIVGPGTTVMPTDLDVSRRLANINSWTVDNYESSGLGGAHTKTVLRDENGDRWLFKPQDEFRAENDVTTSLLQKRVGLTAPDTYVTTYNGRVGSVQQLIGTKSTRKNAFQGRNFDPTKITYADAQSVQRHHVFDWLIGNHDGHTDQFIKHNGDMIGIDKGQAFKFFGKDSLDYTYNPNQKFIGDTVYNQMHRALAEGQDIKGFVFLEGQKPSKLLSYIRDIQRIDDDEWRAIVRPYAEAAARARMLARGSSFENDVEAFLDAAVARKNNLEKDLRRFHADILAKRGKAPRPTGITQDYEGDFALLGMTNGVRTFLSGQTAEDYHRAQRWAMERGNTGWMSYRTYSGGSSGAINGSLRKDLGGTSTAVKHAATIRKNMGSVDVDVILTRGTGPQWIPAEFRDDPRQLIGRVVAARGFVSTSVDSHRAFGGSHKLNIRTRSGGATRGRYIKPISLHPGESELLLDHDTLFFIHDVRSRPSTHGNQWEFDLEVVPRRWAEENGLI